MQDLDARIAAIGLKHAQLPFGRLSYRDVGNGPAIVFLHGIGSASASWLGQIESLSQGFRVLAWDAPGYGESDDLSMEWPTALDYAEVLSQWLDALGLTHFHLVAHSLGTLISLAFGLLDRKPAQSLVYLDATLGYSGISDEERNAKVDQRIEMFEELGPERMAEKRSAALLSENPNAESFELVKWSMSRLRRPGYFQAIRMLATTDALGLVIDQGTPVLVACGTEDRITPEALSLKLADQFKHVEYQSISKAGHVAHIERPEEANALIARHVRRAEANQIHETSVGSG